MCDVRVQIAKCVSTKFTIFRVAVLVCGLCTHERLLSCPALLLMKPAKGCAALLLMKPAKGCPALLLMKQAKGCPALLLMKPAKDCPALLLMKSAKGCLLYC